MSYPESELLELKHALTKNRSEHLGKDVWLDFVIPRFYDKIDLISNMPTRLEGGRGSGKTMLLRYLSYHSQFSKNRPKIEDRDLSRIGLYWKADTRFLRMLRKRGIDDDVWIAIFDHYLVLQLSLEVLNSIYAIAESSYPELSVEQLESLKIDGLSDFRFTSSQFNDFKSELISRIRKTEFSIQNVKYIEEVDLVPSSFLIDIIEIIKETVPALNQTVFSVYIDEYENLIDYQQKVINTKIKHSEPPLIFNIAIKLNGMSETSTLGEEKLENRADYSIVNLDKIIQENSFEIFAAEVLLKRLSTVSDNFKIKYKVDRELLSDQSTLQFRRSKFYEDACLDAIKQILPGRTHSDLADEIFDTPVYKRKVESEIQKALKIRARQDISPELFIHDDYRKASIVCTSLLYRESLSVNEIISEFEKLKQNKPNKFSGKTNWIHNNFIGCYLRIVRSFKGNSTFYSGFDVYTTLSNGNLRHFLELCRTAFSLVDNKYFEENLSIDRKSQHLAARNASDELIREVQRFTPLGNYLWNFVNGLGMVFDLCQTKEAQSEPEATHFGIKGDFSSFSSDDEAFFTEAEKWGVLTSIESTKNKSVSSRLVYDWVLNPIYSPFFFISYRKGRKITLDIEDIRELYTKGGQGLSGIKEKLKFEATNSAVENIYSQGTLL